MSISFQPAQPKFEAQQAAAKKQAQTPKFGLADGGVCSVPACAACCAVPCAAIVLIPAIILLGAKAIKGILGRVGKSAGSVIENVANKAANT